MITFFSQKFHDLNQNFKKTQSNGSAVWFDSSSTLLIM